MIKSWRWCFTKWGKLLIKDSLFKRTEKERIEIKKLFVVFTLLIIMLTNGLINAQTALIAGLFQVTPPGQPVAVHTLLPVGRG